MKNYTVFDGTFLMEIFYFRYFLLDIRLKSYGFFC